MKPSFRGTLLIRLLACGMAAAGPSAWSQTAAADPPHEHASQPKAASAPYASASTANAMPQGRQHTMQSGSLSRADQQFLSKAVAGGQAEVEMARLAQTRAQNDEVKRFAARMVEDHTKVNDELRSLGSARGLSWLDDGAASGAAAASTAARPGHLASAAHRNMERLQNSTGANFDREFMKQMVADHKVAVGDFQHAAASAKDPELRSFAQKTLASLQDHLQQARRISERLSGSSQH